jgi:NAD(P)-dependent dehydrogenase (short-subunit alcohol dehydrogenase family)
MNNIKNTALITGASRGLGLALTAQLARNGYKVWMACRNVDTGKKLAMQLTGDIEVVELDVTDESTVKKAMKIVAATDDKIDLLINNAGVFPSDDEYPQSQPTSVLMDTLAVNVGGVHSVIQAAFPLLKKGKNAAVVNVSSGFGSLELNAGWDTTATCYCTSKAALNMLSLQWSHIPVSYTHLRAHETN